MIAQLRIYTINKGMLESWLSLFASNPQPRMAENEISVQSKWTNEARSQFIWIRTFEGGETDLQIRENGFFESQWWLANVDTVCSHIAHQEVILLKTV